MLTKYVGQTDDIILRHEMTRCININGVVFVYNNLELNLQHSVANTFRDQRVHGVVHFPVTCDKLSRYPDLIQSPMRYISVNSCGMIMAKFYTVITRPEKPIVI